MDISLARTGAIPRPRIGTPKSVNASSSGDTPIVAGAAGRHTIITHLLFSNRDASAVTVAFNWGGGTNFFDTIMIAGQVVALNLVGAELEGPVATDFNVNLSAGGDVLVTAVYVESLEPVGS
jgi:hypothetical protein